MKKIYLSADIEGVCGVMHWDETTIGKPGYDAAARQMTREVAAACEGAMAGGAGELLVKDAHDSGRNLDPAALPQCARILRGWTREMQIMMAELDGSFDGAFLTGCHSGAGFDGNPLAHTMNLGMTQVRINDRVVSEAEINALTAAWRGVPVLLVTGDEALCGRVAEANPRIRTVPVSRGVGGGSVSIHPDAAVERIREAARAAVAEGGEGRLFPLPERFALELVYRKHELAMRNSQYPGARRTGPHAVGFDTADYGEALRFMLFCL